MRYQIRTPENVNIETVIEAMSKKAWRAVAASLDPETQTQPVGNYSDFHERLKIAMNRYLKAFRLCGLSNICIDAVLEAPLSNESRKVGGNPWDLVYHIFVQGDAQDFVNKLANETFHSMETKLEPQEREKASHAVQQAFHDVLKDFLVYNPLCGKTELCEYSGSDEISSWKRK